MKEIMSNIPIQDVKKAIKRSDLMKSYTKYLQEKEAKVKLLKEEIKKNDELLIKKREELKKLNLLTLDGPSRRTRSQGRDNRNPIIEKLEQEIDKLYISISNMKYKLDKLTNPPAYLTNY
tara:strand:- start:479 stop:838 length:360 start_codon:yes stop_codon:yes gene_type:complete